MAKIIITNPKFIVERDGDNLVLKFRDGNIYKPIEFNNAQFSGKKNMVISQPNFSIIDDKLFVNINGHDIKIGEVGDGYTLASKLTRNTIVEPNLDVVITSNGGASVVTEIGGKNITINGGGPEPVYTNRIYYTVVEGGYKPESTWITTKCSENVFNENTGEGYLVLNEGVDTVSGKSKKPIRNIFSDYGSDSNVTSVILPSQITTIGKYAFTDCSGLTSVTIPNSVTSIGDWAFSGCSGLTSVTIPNSVTIILNNAFDYCENLKSLTIPNSVISIGTDALYGCTSLASVTCFATTPPTLGTDVFKDINTTSCAIPEGCVAAYQASDWAKSFTTFTAIQE